MACGVDDDLAFEPDRVDVNEVVAGHFCSRIVHDDPFKDSVSTENKIDDASEVQYLGTTVIGCGYEGAGSMRRIDHVHPFTVLDLFARYPDLLENLVSGGTDRRFVHEISAMPEPSAQRETLFDNDGTKTHVRQIMGTDQAGRPCPYDDDIALDELIELFIVFARDLPRDVSFA